MVETYSNTEVGGRIHWEIPKYYFSTEQRVAVSTYPQPLHCRSFGNINVVSHRYAHKIDDAVISDNKVQHCDW
jgi:hypothetical protein